MGVSDCQCREKISGAMNKHESAQPTLISCSSLPPFNAEKRGGKTSAAPVSRNSSRVLLFGRLLSSKTFLAS